MKHTRRQLLRNTSLVLLAAAPYNMVLAATKPRIIGIRVWPATDYTRITIESDKTLLVESQFFIDSPPRLGIDVKGIDLDDALRELVGKVNPDDPFIIRMRVGQNTPDTVRFVIDLKQNVAPQVFNLQPVAAYQYRLVFDLIPAVPVDPLEALIADRFTQVSKPGGYDTTALDELISSTIHDPLGELIAQKDAQSPSGASTARTDEPHPQAASQHAPPANAAPPPKTTPAKRPIKPTPSRTDRIIIIAIDPGHGGEDPGAIGPRGIREKDVVLKIAKQLAQRINKSKVNGNPMRAFLTRDGDFFVPLGTRVEKARRVQADLFLSIHADAFTTPKAQGGSVFALSQRGASSTAAKWLADHENKADMVGGINFKSHEAQVQQAILDMSTAAQIKDSLMLGHTLLTEIGRVGTLHKRNVEQAGFAVLKAPDIPSVLIETAFISNPAEEAKLRSTAYQQALADAIMVGIGNYFAKNPPLARSRSL